LYVCGSLPSSSTCASPGNSPRSGVVMRIIPSIPNFIVRICFELYQENCNLSPKSVFMTPSGQLLSYVIVIDFESTCWKDKRGGQEISEFLSRSLSLPSTSPSPSLPLSIPPSLSLSVLTNTPSPLLPPHFHSNPLLSPTC